MKTESKAVLDFPHISSRKLDVSQHISSRKLDVSQHISSRKLDVSQHNSSRYGVVAERLTSHSTQYRSS